MNTSSDARNPVELLAEEFLDRKRRGEHPTLREYAERHPELAEEIRDLFPALLMMEDLGGTSGGATGSLASGGVAAGVRLDRLGDYRILREIGRGGMGVVYEAEQESLGRRVALKVLSAGSLLDPKQVRRFEREARAAARLHHTNIVPVFGVGHQDGHHYFVMQFIAGLGLDVVLEDLRRQRGARSGGRAADEPTMSPRPAAGLAAAAVARSLITARFAADGPHADGSVTEPFDPARPIPEPSIARPSTDPSRTVLAGSSEFPAASGPDLSFYRSVARIGIQVAEALEYANRQGVLHRDIKPSNLLLDRRGNVWVADFGLAKITDDDDLTHTGDILGTIRYMAPERFAGHCDARSDVYSLGLTLYELVALRPAYQAADRPALVEQVLHEDPARLKKLVPGVPRDLETIVAKAMSRDPAGRYATAGVLAEDLRRFVEDRPIRARRISAAERSVRWCRRNKGLATSIGVTMAALVASLAFALRYAEDQYRIATAQTLHVRELDEAKTKITTLADDLRASLDESNARLAMLNFERGRSECEQGQIGPGLLWMTESWRMAERSGDLRWQRLARKNLAAWGQHHARLTGVFSQVGLREIFELSPDGRKVLTAGSEMLQVWDVDGSRPHGPPWHHPSPIKGAAFRPDGNVVVTGGVDGIVRFWEVDSGRLLGQAVGHRAPVNRVTFRPDGKAAASASQDGTARLWDAGTGQPIGRPLQHGNVVNFAVFSPDGRTLLTGGDDKTARLWDAGTGRPVGPPMPHREALRTAEFSPDSATIVTGCWDGTARLWDAATGRPIGRPLQHQGPVNEVRFSPDGLSVLTGSQDGTARLWDARTGEPLGAPLQHPGWVMPVAFSPDGRFVLTGCQDHAARLWDAASGQPLGLPMPHRGPVRSVAFGPDGTTILTGSADQTARLWKAATERQVGLPLLHGGSVNAVALSPDGKLALTGSSDGIARLWDTATGRPVGLPLHHRAAVMAVAFSPDGRSALTGSKDRTARLWDVDTGRPFGRPLQHPAMVSAVAFSPDGKTLLTECWDRAARLWDARTGRSLGPPLSHHPVQDQILAVAFSPDGMTFLCGSLDGTAWLWDARTGRSIGRPLVHQDRIGGVAFSPDGMTILTGGWDGTARLWDARTGRPVGQPLPHQGPVYSVAYSRDGTTILTGCEDRTARLWDVATARPIGPPLRHQGPVQAVAFGGDGTMILTGSEDRTARLWRVAELPDRFELASSWVATRTGLDLDDQGRVRILDNAAWTDRRHRLSRLGEPDPRQDGMYDPILFGPDPAARGQSLMAHGRWDAAEVAISEAIRARPDYPALWVESGRLHTARSRPQRAAADFARAFSLGARDPRFIAAVVADDAVFEQVLALLPDTSTTVSLWVERGRDQARRWQWNRAHSAWTRAIELAPGDPLLRRERADCSARQGRWPEVAADYGEAIRLDPEEPRSRGRRILALLAAGDGTGVRQATADLLARFGATTDPHTANNVAWLCLLAPDPAGDHQAPILLASRARKAWPVDREWVILNTLGAALFRAGRLEEAVFHLEEGIRKHAGGSVPEDWAFLAMAQHKLGRRAEARAWLRRFDAYRPVQAPEAFWEELEIRLLRSEAEAVILYDPVFPDDPFAH